MTRRSRSAHSRRLALVGAIATTCLAGAVQATSAQALPTLTPADYGQWESLGATVMDPTGRWIAVQIRTIDGDGEVRVYASDGSGSARVLPSFQASSGVHSWSSIVTEPDSASVAKPPSASRHLRM